MLYKYENPKKDSPFRKEKMTTAALKYFKDKQVH